MTELTTLGAILASNIKTARVLRRFEQQDLADRMRGLGYKWVRQTVGEAENSRRRLTVEETFALALALDTTVERLMMPQPWADEEADEKPVKLPSGITFPWPVVRYVISGGDPSGETTERRDRHLSHNRGIRWEGNALVRVSSRWDDGEK
jgi:transcriptional regulator with XRE-family HTH domain